MRVHSGRVIWSLAFSPDGRWLASGADDSYVRIWDVSDFSEEHRFLAGSPTLSVAWSPDGSKIASVAGPRVIVWTLADEKELFNNNLNYAMTALDWSPDGSKIAAASALRWIFILSGDTGDTIGTLKGHTEDVQTVAWAPDSNLLASGGEDFTVRLWDVNQSLEIATLHQHTDQVFSVDFSQDGKMLASGSADRTIHLWEVDTFQHIGEIKTNINSVQSVAFSTKPGNQLFATASRDKTIGLYEVITEQPLSKVLLSSGGQVKTLILRDDTLLEGMGSRSNNLLLVWQVDPNNENSSSQVSTKNTENAQIFAMSLDGQTLALGYRDGQIRVVNWETNDTQQTFHFCSGLWRRRAKSGGWILHALRRTNFFTNPRDLSTIRNSPLEPGYRHSFLHFNPPQSNHRSVSSVRFLARWDPARIRVKQSDYSTMGFKHRATCWSPADPPPHRHHQPDFQPRRTNPGLWQ